MENREIIKRPIGLTIFALLNFIYAAFALFIFTTEVISASLDLAAFTIFFVPMVLLFLSSAGFMKMKWGMGYIIGNIAGIILIPTGIVLAFSALLADNLSDNPLPPLLLPLLFLFFLAIIYPLSLLLFLNFRYKKYFEIFRK